MVKSRWPDPHGFRGEIAQDIQSCAECFLIRRFLKTFVVIHAVLVGMMSIPDVAMPPILRNRPRKTPAALKPKNAVLTTSVEPAEAKPGDTVTFKVTAKLDPGTHIYKYSKTVKGGPINTTFDFFDTAGLKIEGDWVLPRNRKSTRTQTSPTSNPWNITKTR